MKRLWMVLVLTVIMLMSMPAALAAGETEPAEQTVIAAMNSTCVNTGLLSEECWKNSWTCYGDQLDGDAAVIYAALEDAFLENGMCLQEVAFTNGVSNWTEMCWMRNGVYTCTRDYSGQSELNAIFSEVQATAMKACYAFTYDHPEYFWIRTDVVWGASYYDRGTEVEIINNVGFRAQPSCDTQAEIDALQSRLDLVIKKLVEDTENMPVVQRLAYWDNWLAEKNHYNYEAVRTNTYIKQDETPWSIAGALLDEYSPVCEGYAKAFQLLCHEIGVPCLQISGSVKVNGSWGGHMWTAVQLNGKWYVCDPTWDDPSFLLEGVDHDYSSRDYFLVGERMSHRPDMKQLITPEINSETYFTAWDLTKDGLSGCEQGGGDMLIALYDITGKMLACDFCPSFYWTKTTLSGIGYDGYMYLSPDFDEAVLNKAVKAVRFRLYEGAWAPAGQKLPIT